MYSGLEHLVLGYSEQPRRRWEFSGTSFVFRYRMMFHTLFTGKYFKSTNVNPLSIENSRRILQAVANYCY